MSDRNPSPLNMNTLEVLYRQYSSTPNNSHPPLPGCCAVLKLLQIHQQRNPDGVIRLASQVPVLNPASQTVVVNGTAEIPTPCAGQSAIIEHPVVPLPGGRCVVTCLITLQDLPPRKDPVVLRIASEQDVCVIPSSVITHIGSSLCAL